MTMKKILSKKIILHVFLALVILPLAFPVETWAVAVDYGFYSSNDIQFYDPNACADSGASTTTASNGNIVAIGDSIMVGLIDVGFKNKLKTAGYTDVTLDGVGSRSLISRGDGDTTGIEAVTANTSKVQTAGTVLVEIGTNADNTFDATLPKMIKTIRDINPTTRILWSNVGTTSSSGASNMVSANNTIDKYKSSLDYTVIDWASVIQAHPDYLGSDGTHPNPNGYSKMAEFEVSKIGPATSGDINTANGTTGGTTPAGSDSSCCDTSNNGGGAATSGSTAEQNQANTWNYFINKGLTPIQAAGAMGNIAIESGFYPDRVQGKSPQDGSKDPSSVSVGWGLIQWTPGSKIIGIASNAGITKPIYELQTQLDIIWWHMTHASPTGVQNMLKSYNPSDAKEAARLFEQYMEGAGVKAYPDREAAAAAALKKFGNSQVPSSSSCPGSTSSDGKVVTIDGHPYALPVSREIVNNLPCKQSSCHHDGTPAADLGITPKSEGTPVYAITSGMIENRHYRAGPSGNAPQECESFHIKGDDGWDYWYGHIRGVSVNNGEKVKAGQQIAEIGQSACADNTPPHLHIDRGSPKGYSGGLACCRDSGFVPLLNKIWEETS